MTYKYQLSDDTWGKEEINAILEVITSGKFTMGDRVKAFEKAFSEYFGSKYAIMVNSGSSANLVLISALLYSGKINKGDEIIVPAVSWSTTYFPLIQNGLKIKFVDIDRETLNIDISKLERAISKNTKAIFAVNLLGNPNNFELLFDICQKYNLLLIEDNCEALGAKYNSKYTGTFGIAGSFSFFYSHHICTMEGGMVATDDKELYEYMLSLRAHGWTRNLPKDSEIYQKNPDEFYELFNFILPGYNLRPLEIEAAIGIEQLKKVDKIIENRRENAQYFKERLDNMRIYDTQKEIGESSWFGFPIILKEKYQGKRDLVVNFLKEKGIEVRPIVAGNFLRNPVIKYLDYDISGNVKNSDYIHDNGFFVGNHSVVDYDGISYLMDNLEEISKEMDNFK